MNTNRFSNLAVAASQALGINVVVEGRRAWYRADEVGSAYWVSASDLRYAMECRANPATTRDAYSHWCAGSGREMSARAQRARGLR